MKKQPLGLKFKLTPDKVLVVVAEVLGLGLTGAGVFLVPKIVTCRDSLKEDTAKMEVLKSKADILEQWAANSNALKQDETVLTNALPTLIDTPDLMGRVSQVATDSAVIIRDFQLVAKGTAATQDLSRSSQATSFSLTASGPYTNVVAFIKNLENFAGIIGFNDLRIDQAHQLEGDTGGEPSDTLEVTATLGAYYLPVREENLPVDQKIDFNLDDKAYIQQLKRAKQMVYWQAEQYQDSVGKANPFVR